MRRSRCRDVAQHPRDDPPAPEGLQVLALRVLGARAAEDVAARAVVELGRRRGLQRIPGDRQVRQLTGQTLQVDLVLVVAERRRRGVGRLVGHRPPQPTGGPADRNFARVLESRTAMPRLRPLPSPSCCPPRSCRPPSRRRRRHPRAQARGRALRARDRGVVQDRRRGPCRQARSSCAARELKLGMRVTFRWSKGAIATKLHRGAAGWVARVPPGVRPGKVQVTVRDGAGRRSNVVKITVLAEPKEIVAPALSGDGSLPAAFRGNGMWIWQLEKSEGGNVDAIAARAAAAVGLHRLRQGRRRHDAVGPVLAAAGRRAAPARAEGLRVAVRLRQQPRRRGERRRRGDRGRRRLLRHRRRGPVRGQVRRRADLHERAARRRRAELPDRPDVVPVRRLPPGPAVQRVPGAGRRAGQPAAGLLEGHRRHGRRDQRSHARPQPDLPGADRAARADLRQPVGRRPAALPPAVGGLRHPGAVVVELAGDRRRALERAQRGRARRRASSPTPAGPRSARAPRATR